MALRTVRALSVSAIMSTSVIHELQLASSSVCWRRRRGYGRRSPPARTRCLDLSVRSVLLWSPHQDRAQGPSGRRGQGRSAAREPPDADGELDVLGDAEDV